MRIGLVGVGRIGAFHAATLKGLPAVEQVVVADADPSRAELVAKDLGLEYAPDVDALLASGPDGFVIAAATSAHADLIAAGVAARIPTFCEKPVAIDLDDTLRVVELVEGSDVPVHIGFQRRFDAGYQAAAASVRSGELGFVHHIRANTNDAFPPPAEYIPTSGGFFRDCTVHDFDIIRFVTGREVVSVFATGANRGETFFGAYGDVDAAAALLTLDDNTFVSVSGTRYNAAGHDVRAHRAAVGRSRCHVPRRSAARHLHGPLPVGVCRRADRVHRGRRRDPRGPLHGPGRLPGLPDRRRLRTVPAREPPRPPVMPSTADSSTREAFDRRGDRPDD
jgi:myo-inositol 2-dehydrogenase/D-chiro-inositol 1-dehydrogenase